MTELELLEFVKKVQKMKCEMQTLELKTAREGCPKRLYDTLSIFFQSGYGRNYSFWHR